MRQYPLDHILVFNHGNGRGNVPFVGLNILRTQACKLHNVQGNANKIFGKEKEKKKDVDSSIIGNVIIIFFKWCEINTKNKDGDDQKDCISKVSK